MVDQRHPGLQELVCGVAGAASWAVFCERRRVSGRLRVSSGTRVLRESVSVTGLVFLKHGWTRDNTDGLGLLCCGEREDPCEPQVRMRIIADGICAGLVVWRVRVRARARARVARGFSTTDGHEITRMAWKDWEGEVPSEPRQNCGLAGAAPSRATAASRRLLAACEFETTDGHGRRG
jgi:hypothetical protein